MAKSQILWQDGARVVDPQINADGVHVYPFVTSFPIDVRFFALNGRTGVRMNRHHYYELCYVSSGKTEWYIQDTVVAAGAGDLIVMGSDIYHRPISVSSAASRLKFLFFKPALLSLSVHGNSDEQQLLMPFHGQTIGFRHVIPAETGLPRHVSDLIQQIHQELPATTACERLAIRTYLQMIMVLLLKHYAAHIDRCEYLNRRRAELERLRPVFDYLELQSHLQIHIDTVAHLCAMSGSHFMSLFKRATGQSFHCYLNQFRIARAQVLLATTDKALDVISHETGFCNQSYFGSIFRKLVGETPRAYRRRSGDDIGHLPDRDHVPLIG
ncbi:MAG TPA: AraC family transcriptional regulator [Acidobacteriaceae bacterium]|jgi:AraC-like DNA-binding protein|nr:AraC family transcriptional regulator [Acidobacteriaceae bacterium]